MLRWVLLILGSAGVVMSAVVTAEGAAVEDMLKREVIGPKLALVEVQAYAERLVPAMPGIQDVRQWESIAERIRSEVLRRVVYSGEGARWRDARTRVQWLGTVEAGPGYRIHKLRYEAVPGLWIPALMYRPNHLGEKVPAILNFHGHDLPLGKANVDKQIRCINLVKRGMLVFSPGWIGTGQLTTPNFLHKRLSQLDLCGTNNVAVFYLCMKRALDVLLSEEHADPKRVAVAGLSGGGWQTIFFSALDTRVTLTNPVAGYASYRTAARHPSDLGCMENLPCDLATIADYTHLTALMAPRPTLLTYNAKDDCCYQAPWTLPPLLEAAGPIFELYGKRSHLRGHVNHDPGTHNFGKDNREAFYRMIGEHFYEHNSRFDPREIPVESEVKSKQQLWVELPPENLDTHKLALRLSQGLPRQPHLPENLAAARKWQEAGRTALYRLVRAKHYQIEARRIGGQRHGDLRATFWQFKVDGTWTLPAVELWRGQPTGTVILVGDRGRGALAEHAERLLKEGKRVLAVDPLNIGESSLAGPLTDPHLTQSRFRDYRYPLLISALGERPLGLLASQLTAVARWSNRRDGTGAVTLVGVGERASTFSLVAAALEPEAIAGVHLFGPLGSLKEMIRRNWTFLDAPELFCFGLLESFDVKHLAALVAPRPVVIRSASESAKKELAELEKWYATLDVRFHPLQ